MGELCSPGRRKLIPHYHRGKYTHHNRRYSQRSSVPDRDRTGELPALQTWTHGGKDNLDYIFHQTRTIISPIWDGRLRARDKEELTCNAARPRLPRVLQNQPLHKASPLHDMQQNNGNSPGTTRRTMQRHTKVRQLPRPISSNPRQVPSSPNEGERPTHPTHKGGTKSH